MEPTNLRFGGGATETLLNPLVALWMIIAIGLILTVPRNKAITPFLLACFTIPIGQVVVLAGLHFTVLRILILAGLARRAIVGREKYPGSFNLIDRAVVPWQISAMIILSVQWMNGQEFIHNLGDLVDGLGGYLVFRFMVNDSRALERTIKVLAAICAIQGVCMINEQINHVNVFGLLGGIAGDVTVRDGQIRSSGVLGCIYAGAFSGVLIPLFLWILTRSNSRMAGLMGLVSAIVMVITSHSSTSILALGGSIVGLGFWFLRRRMRLVRWALVGILVSLHMAMKAPVWALIARIDLTGSSSGDHRFKLVDNCIRHFSDWWLLGYKYYNNWGWDMWDLCNQFVVVALTGGLLTLIFYIAIFIRSFGALGTARKQVEGDRGREWLLWCLGSALLGTVVAHFGINYMAALMMGFYPLLACISVATFEAGQVRQSVKLPIQQQRQSAAETQEELSWFGA